MPQVPELYLKIIAAVALVAMLGSAATSSAQSPSPGPDVGLRFVGGPVWRAPGQPLNLRLQIRNSGPEPLEGFRVIVGVSDRVLTRSALEASFVSQPGISASSLPFAFEDTVGSFASTRVTIDEATSSFATLASATEGGVYPATIALQDPETLQVLATVQIPLIYYPEPPETRLNIVPLLPLNDRPNLGPNARFIEGTGESIPLVEGAQEGGWLEGFLDSLEEVTAEPPPEEQGSKNTKGNRKKNEPAPPDPLRISLSTSPRMLDELVDLSTGATTAGGDPIPVDSQAARAAAEVVGRLADLAARPAIQTVVTPYAFADIPTLVDQLPTDHLLEQFSAARSVLRETLGPGAARGWLFPPAGRLDEPSLERLQLIQDLAANVFISSDSLESVPAPEGLAGCPELSQSFTCPISITTGQGTTTGLRADPGLSTRLSSLQLANNDRLSLQRFFAETSMIREEAPGVEDRVIQATIPSLWQPPPRLSRTLLVGLRDAPWLRSLRADEAVDLTTPVEQTVIPESPVLAGRPDEPFFDAVQETSELLESYAAFAPPDNPRLPRFRANLLVAQSRTIWRDAARTSDYVSSTRSEAEEEMGKISIQGTDDFTCTSRDCRLQLLLSNDANYPARVSLELISPGLRLDPSEIEGVFQPGDHPLTVKAATSSSGISRLAARLETTDGGYVIQEKEVVIRSTNFNRIALILTLGALGFLILFYIGRSLRRSKRSGSKPE